MKKTIANTNKHFASATKKREMIINSVYTSAKVEGSKTTKKELKEQVLLRLRSRFLPVPGEFNVLWASDKNEVWFASTQNKMIDLFMEEFLKSFELHLEQLTPYNLAVSMLDEESLIRLDKLEPTQFAPLS